MLGDLNRGIQVRCFDHVVTRQHWGSGHHRAVADGAAAAIWRLTPRQSIAAECQRRGRPALVAGCIDLLQGRHDVADSLLLALGGPPAQAVLGGQAGGKTGYRPRVWAARGLLHAWEDRATVAIIQATNDDAWRVRAIVILTASSS